MDSRTLSFANGDGRVVKIDTQVPTAKHIFDGLMKKHTEILLVLEGGRKAYLDTEQLNYIDFLFPEETWRV